MIDKSIEIYYDVLVQNIKANKEIIILSMLSQKPMCGTELIKEIFSRTKVFLSQGTVYPILYSFEEAKVLQAKHERGNMKAKKYYVTPEGKDILQTRMKEFAKAISTVSSLVQGE